MRKIFILLTSILSIHFISSAQLSQISDSSLITGEIKSMLTVGTDIYSYGEVGGIFKSSDGGKTWSFMSSTMDSSTNNMQDLIYFNNKFYALLSNQDGNNFVVFSSDSCKSWQNATNITGLPNRDFQIQGLGTANNLVFMYLTIWNLWSAGDDSSYIYYSSNAINWTEGAYLGTNLYLRNLCHFNSHKLYLSFNQNGMDTLMYTSDGTSVHSIPTTGLNRSQFSLYSFTVDKNNSDVYCGNNGDPFRFDSVQNKWINIRGTGLNALGAVDGIVGDGNALFTYVVFMQGANLVVEAYRSLNKGGLWQKIPSAAALPPIPRIAVAISDSNYVMNTQLDDIIYSFDTGYSWKTVSSGYQNKVVGSLTEINNVLVTHNIVKGLLRSTDKGTSWSYSNTGLTQGMPGAYFPVETFKGGGKLFVSMEQSPDGAVFDLFRSPNDGVSWAKLTSIPSYKNMSYYGENGNSFIMRYSDEHDRNTSWDTNCFYFRTSDAGNNWTDISSNFFKSSAMNLAKVYGFIGDGNTLFLFGHNKDYASVIYYSTNNGLNWTKVGKVYQQIKTKDSWSKTARRPLCATNNKGNFIFIIQYWDSNDTGDSLYSLTSSGFSSINTTGLPDGIVITDINYFDDYWYLSTTIGLFASKNGIDWKQAAVNNYYLGMNADKMSKIDNQLFIGTFGNGIWKFTNEELEIGGYISVCDGDSVTLTATGADSNFSWCCGYGSSRTITIKPSMSTDITATALDQFGFTITDTVHITVRPKPTANFSIVDDKQCFIGNNFNFLNSSIITSGTFNSIWDFGDGNKAYSQDESHTYTVYDSSYDVNLLVVSSYGCKDSISKSIFFEEEPIATISIAGDNEICDGDSVTLYTNSGTNFTYQWMKDGNTIGGATNPYYLVTGSGKYNFKLTDNITSCFATSSEIEVIVHTTNLNPNFTASPRTPSWNSGAQQFDAVAFTNLTLNPGDFNFSWLFGDGNIDFDSDPFHNYKYNGTYSVSLTAEHQQTGCKDTFSREDYILCSGGSVNPCPITVEITYSGIPIICKHDSLLITATTTGNVLNYIWTHEGNVLIGENDSTLYAKEKGNYQVIVNDTSCSVVSIPFILNNYPIVEPIIQSEGSIRPCSSDSMRLFNTTFYSAYKWSTGANGTSIYVKESGEYFLTVTDIYGCQATSTPFSVNASLLQKPEICLVTVDTISKKNLIAWERPQSNVIQGYKIYKEGFQANVYNLIGYLPYDSVSVFLDTASVPQQRSNRYKISLVDTCNIESAPSQHHKTIHLSANTGTSGENNLIWSHYEGFEFSSYKIYRGTTPANIILLDSVPSNLNSYSDLNPPSGLVFYQVNVVKYDSCFPTILRGQTNKGPFSQSMSNLRDYNATQTDYLEVSQDSHTFDTSGGSFVFDVFTSLSSWNAVSDQSWLTLVLDVANNKFTATASKNTETIPRQAIITLSGDNVGDVLILVMQDGVVNIPELNGDQSVFVYPNPFDQYFYLYMPGTKGEKKVVSLLDMNGKTVLNGVYQGDELIKIERNNLARGMYFIRVVTDKAFMQKVMAY